jgi:hypothetical protein
MRSARYPPFIMCRTCRIVTTYEKRNVLSVMDGVEGAIHTTDYSTTTGLKMLGDAFILTEALTYP